MYGESREGRIPDGDRELRREREAVKEGHRRRERERETQGDGEGEGRATEEEGEAAGHRANARRGRDGGEKKEGGREARRVDNRARSCLSLVSFCCLRSRESAVDELRSLVPVDGTSSWS